MMSTVICPQRSTGNNELAWQVELIMSGGAIHPPFANKQELAEWCKANQPYYKKKIAAINNYFARKYNLN